jgi:hypothetical protein
MEQADLKPKSRVVGDGFVWLGFETRLRKA